MSSRQKRGAALDPELLLRAYSIGIFPMAESRDAEDVFWVEPRERAILPLEGFHLSRSLGKTLKQGRFTHSVDRAFEAVIDACAQPAPDRADTWINRQIREAYTYLHRIGHAHSIECWDAETLVGGLYGVRIGGAFFGESMFSRRTDASKAALAHLIARMRFGGFRLLDCQFMTGHLASLGAVEIRREAYLQLLGTATGVANADFGALTRGEPDISGARIAGLLRASG
ncbi:leucyl/phenylalanyl-tRNA--protein transferase [Sphingosinicella soli]|uniref:Leucyl/phenylalanyl-tRNA--protein transferase n=1 Tax=Sphingosinicella soli TaxID=333708 RepID=A0A7W7B3K3_9SPHN|nr:leucyl/phenylalanyl-tRNA--protein transferase [Sphingosinicella soli]MBB4632493.1 leucyl/phenylalanyl-tRNA--protein transferase [Sphingosinicella soli]